MRYSLRSDYCQISILHAEVLKGSEEGHGHMQAYLKASGSHDYAIPESIMKVDDIPPGRLDDNWMRAKISQEYVGPSRIYEKKRATSYCCCSSPASGEGLLPCKQCRRDRRPQNG